MVRLKKVLTKVPGFDIITPALSESTLDQRAANLENDTENKERSSSELAKIGRKAGSERGGTNG